MSSPHFSRSRSFVILLLSLLLAILVIAQFLTPFRQQVATRYIARGDTYLAGQEFEAAAGEYQKALNFDGSNQLADQRLKLAQKGPTDLAALRAFFVEKGEKNVVADIDRATKPYTNPKDALQVGVAFYTQQEYALAQYSLVKAITLDPQYAEAWNYLRLTYQELAKDDSSFSQKAAQAFAKRDDLTPAYLTK